VHVRRHGTHPGLIQRSPSFTLPRAARELRMLKRHGVGEGQSALGPDFTSRIVELASISIAHCNCFEFQLLWGSLVIETQKGLDEAQTFQVL
jgi:hypothetical protein